MSFARIAVFLAACAGCSVAPAPSWKTETRDALEGFTAAYLAGDTRAADRYFRAARATVSGTGRADLVGRVELIRCAIGTAALDASACAGVEGLRADLTGDDDAYAGFLEGKLDPAQAGRLPEQYRGLAKAGDAYARSRALKDIEDPVSRLVAAGALFRGGSLSPEGIATAVDTASEQAWRHPLLAYLNVQARLAEAAGDGTALAAVRRRIDLVSSSPGRKE